MANNTNPRKRGRPLAGSHYSAGTLFGGGANADNARMDPYPAVLQRIGALLDHGWHAPNIGTAEAQVLEDIAHAVRSTLAVQDQASVHLIPNPEDW